MYGVGEGGAGQRQSSGSVPEIVTGEVFTSGGWFRIARRGWFILKYCRLRSSSDQVKLSACLNQTGSDRISSD